MAARLANVEGIYTAPFLGTRVDSNSMILRGYFASAQFDYHASGYAFQVPVNDFLVSVATDPDSNLEPVNKIYPYFDPVNVPEPASLALFGIGALGAAAFAARRTRTA